MSSVAGGKEPLGWFRVSVGGPSNQKLSQGFSRARAYPGRGTLLGLRPEEPDFPLQSGNVHRPRPLLSRVNAAVYTSTRTGALRYATKTSHSAAKFSSDKNPDVTEGARVADKRLGAVLSKIRRDQQERYRKRLASGRLTVRQKNRIRSAINPDEDFRSE